MTPKEFLKSYVEKFNAKNVPDGKPFNIGGKATDVLRQQSDGTWRIVIDNPWGSDI
jgi:ketosteroid isomerase-like protein